MSKQNNISKHSTLEELRNTIDELDKELISLLEKRFIVCQKIGDYKKSNNLNTYNPQREAEILNNIKNTTSLKLKDALEKIYLEIFKISKNLQK